MPNLFAATLGQRPEAITVALDELHSRHNFAAAAILHTEPQLSGIAEAYNCLKTIFSTDYPGLLVRWHEILRAQGAPLIDITNQDTANDYFQGVLRVLRSYRDDGYTIHLLVAGGRKAMTIYATLAAALIFGPRDRVWTVLTPSSLIQERLFHLPPGTRDQVILVDLPILPPRLMPAENAALDDPLALIARRRNPRRSLLNRLTPAERATAELLERHPYATNEELAGMLGKSPRTVENQLQGIYRKMIDLCDEAETATSKRQILLDILGGRV